MDIRKGEEKHISYLGKETNLCQNERHALELGNFGVVFQNWHCSSRGSNVQSD